MSDDTAGWRSVDAADGEAGIPFSEFHRSRARTWSSSASVADGPRSLPRESRATLSEVTAQKEYGVSRDFIVNGIRAGKLEYREGA